MKHLTPSLLAQLADGAKASAAANAHLRACADCRAQLAELRALMGALSEAPAVPAGLHDATLQRLGLRASGSSGLWRWSWAPLALAGLLAGLLWQRPAAQAPAPATPKAPAPAHIDLASVPHPQRAPRSAAEAREQMQDAAVAAMPAVTAPSAQAAPAVGAAPQATAVVAAHVEAAPKLSPTPLPAQAMTVAVRNNLIKPGQALALTVDLAEPGPLSAHVFDQRGRVIETLYQGPAGPGSVILNWDAKEAPSAAYTVLLQSGRAIHKLQVIVAH